jgi:hypothetical protein
MKFLLGASGLDTDNVSRDMVNNGSDALRGALSAATSGMPILGDMVSRITGVVSKVAAGDSIIFPKVYHSSRYSRSYDISVDLRSPYGDDKSYAINIIAPLIHWICLAAPKSTSANSYFAPWIIRAEVPGSWYCDMGIISSLSITRNADINEVSARGLPLAVKVEIQIEDLYQDLTVPGSTEYEAAVLVSNNPLTQYIAAMTGFDVLYPDQIAALQMKAGAVGAAMNPINRLNTAKNALTNFVKTEIFSKKNSL